MLSATEMQVSMIESMGALTLGMAIAGFFALSGTQPHKVTAYALILPLVNTAKWLLNGTGKKLGMPDQGQYLNGGIMPRDASHSSSDGEVEATCPVPPTDTTQRTRPSHEKTGTCWRWESSESTAVTPSR